MFPKITILLKNFIKNRCKKGFSRFCNWYSLFSNQIEQWYLLYLKRVQDQVLEKLTVIRY